MRKIYQYEEVAAKAGQTIAGLISKSQPIYILLGEVEVVNEEAKTIDAVVDDNRVFRDIPLEVVPNGSNSVYFLPAVGSIVTLGFVEGSVETAFVIKTTTVDKILISNAQEESSSIYIDNEYIEIIRGSSTWKIEDKKITLNAELIEMNGGENGGLVKIEKLLQAINKNVNAFNSHTHSGVVIAAEKAIVGNSSSPNARESTINKGDVEDTKIKH